MGMMICLTENKFSWSQLNERQKQIDRQTNEQERERDRERE